MKLRAYLPLLLLTAASCSSPGKSKSTGPSAAAASPGVETSHEETCKPKRVHAKDAVSMEEYLQNELAPPLLSIEELVENLRAARAELANFAEKDFEDAGHTRIGGVSSHEVRGSDLRALVGETVAAAESFGAPTLYTGQDVMGYPRVAAVWEDANGYRLVRANQNNDNDSVSWWRGGGAFQPAVLGLEDVKKISDESATMLSLSPFLEDTKTVYPHIEEYHLCTD